MGCSSSVSAESRVNRTHPLVSANANVFQKIGIYEAVKKDEAFLITKFLNEIKPTENLGAKGDNFTCLHLAALSNSFQVMDVLITWLTQDNPDNIKEIMSIPDIDDRTPVTLCIMKDSIETLFVLVKANVIDWDYKDKKGKSLVEICQRYASTCIDILEKEMKKAQGQPHQEEDLGKEKKLNNIAEKITRTKTFALEQENYRKAPAGDDNALLGVPIDSKTYKLIKDLKLKETQDNFKDSDFPTVVETITNDAKNPYYKTYADAVWKRPHEIFKCGYDNIYLFDAIDPSDIVQGLLGVCYLLASLSALAEFPSRLAPIYLNKKSNKYGVYGLRMFIKGIPQEVIVDDHFPCYAHNNLPLFARPKGRELWVLLAEKAWAKIFKNYTACEVGFMDEALECLLGAPGARHITGSQTVDEVWNILLNADKNKFVITAGTHGQVSEKMGLVPNHGYSIISAHEHKKYRILKLRNPWGKFEWKGDFSDNSKLWTKELKEKIGYSNEDDGLFCMKVEDFKNCFSFYSIGMYHEGWEYFYLEAESHRKHAEYFKFTIEDPCEAYFRIHQDDKRNMPEDYMYSTGDLVICRVEEDGTLRPMHDLKKLHTGVFLGARSLFPTSEFKINLDKPGDYIIRTKMRWKNGEKGQFTLSSYAPTKITLEHIPSVKDYIPRLLQYVGQKAEQSILPSEWMRYSSLFCFHYIYICVANKGEKDLDFIARYNTMENVRLTKHAKIDEKTCGALIPPGKTQVFYAKKINIHLTAKFDWNKIPREKL